MTAWLQWPQWLNNSVSRVIGMREVLGSSPDRVMCFFFLPQWHLVRVASGCDCLSGVGSGMASARRRIYLAGGNFHRAIVARHCMRLYAIWAPSSEFVSSSIPSWQILTAHAQPFRGARDLAFCLKVPLDSLLVWASSGGSGETARMRRLAWTFAARIGDKYQIRLARLYAICPWPSMWRLVASVGPCSRCK